MANIYDMNAAIQKPSILGAVQQGMQFGQQQRQLKQEQADKEQLRNLAPQIISGDPGAYDQAAAINPEAAGQYQKAGDSKLTRFKGMMDYINKARATAKQTGDMRYVNAALQQAAPYIANLTGKPPPAEWTPDMDAGWAQLEAQVAMAGKGAEAGTVHSQKIGADGMIYNTMRDGTLVNTGIKADRQMWFRDHPGMDPQLVGKDGMVMPVGQPQGMPQATPQPVGAPAPAVQAQDGSAMPVTQFVGSDGQPVNVGNDLPPEFRASLLGNTGAYNAAPSGASAQIGPQALPQQAGSLARPSEAQTAAQVEAAKQQAQLQYLPQELQLRTDAALGEAAGKASIERTGKAQAELPKVIQTADETIALLQQAINHPGRATATGLSGRLDPRNYTPGSDAMNFKVLLDQLGGRAFLQAFESLKGGGQITEIEGKKATEAMARLNTAQSDEEFVRSLQELIGIAENAKQRALQAAGSRPAPESGGVDDLLSKYGIR